MNVINPDILEDATTHRHAWLSMFDDKIVDNPEDKSYWIHEKNAFIRLLDLVKTLRICGP